MNYSEQKIRILKDAESSTEALQGLFSIAQEATRSLSLAKFCAISGIKSKGYLSDVLKGKRLLNMKYLEGVGRALGLEGALYEYLKTLLERDLCKNADSLDVWNRLLGVLAKSFDVVETALPVPKDTGLLEFEIFCAFGLFGGTPSRSQLVKYFGNDRALDVDAALVKLERRQWIEKSAGMVGQPRDANYRLLAQQIAFVDDQQNMSHEDFLRQAIHAAARQVSRWHKKREEAHFESFIISVDDKMYRQTLSELKKQLLTWHAKLETVEADRLIRFNLQIFPIN